MSFNRNFTPALLEHVNVYQEAITTAVCQALREAPFSNRLAIAPRRLNEIGRQETAALLEFLQTRDEEPVRQRGRQLAVEGLGYRSILTMTEALRRTCWESVYPNYELLPAVMDAAGSYVSLLLEAYMMGREEDLLREQERTREAFLRARERGATQ
jgi:hypothetical protein